MHRARDRTTTFADGATVPLLGLGVWQVPDGPTCIKAVRRALEVGYRHIDIAQAYGNEESVGAALRDSGLARDDVFVTTKFYPGHRDPVAEIEASLRRLGLDQVDLYIIHWPQGGPTWAWPGMERARERGYARSIGVSNFDVRELGQVMAAATVQPVVDQVQFSPFEYRKRLLDTARQREVAIEAYSPLGTGQHLSHPAVRRVAEAAGRTPAQVLLRWCIQRGTIVLTKSTHRGRIEENALVFEFELSEEQMEELDALDATGRTDRALERPWWR